MVKTREMLEIASLSILHRLPSRIGSFDPETACPQSRFREVIERNPRCIGRACSPMPPQKVTQELLLQNEYLAAENAPDLPAGYTRTPGPRTQTHKPQTTRSHPRRMPPILPVQDLPVTSPVAVTSGALNLNFGPKSASDTNLFADKSSVTP